MPVSDEQLKAAKAAKPQGFTPDSRPPAPAADQPTPDQPASGHRVEAVNALALANRQMVQELQQVITVAAESQQAAAKQTAQAMKLLLNREYFHHCLLEELGDVLGDVKPVETADLKAAFDPITPQNLLPSWEKVVYDELKLLPAA